MSSMSSDFDSIRNWEKAEAYLGKIFAEGRTTLHEYEVYRFLQVAGVCTSIPHTLIRGEGDDLSYLDAIPGETVVMKIVHPRIAHKTEVQGVRFVPRQEVKDQLAHFFSQVPQNLLHHLQERHEWPRELADLSEKEILQRFKNETVGVLISKRLPPPCGFGHELFLGMRQTREFGPVMTVGLGGVDTEFLARSMKSHQASYTFSVDPSLPFPREALDRLVVVQTLTGKARGHAGVVQEFDLFQLVEKFRAMAAHFSSLGPSSRFWFTEFEINPFFFHSGQPLAVDGLMRFEPARPRPPQSPRHKIKHLLFPRTAGVIGVSSKGMNVGRHILGNLRQGKLKTEQLFIVKEGEKAIDGVKCYPSISSLPQKVDLFVLTTPAPMVPDLIREMVNEEKAESIILITGGMGETEGGESLEAQIRTTLDESRQREDQGPVMVGGNSLGVISRPGGYDTLFIPETKLPRNPQHPLGKNVAVLSQSGAFAISRMSKAGGFIPQVLVSSGNQVDLGIGDFLTYLADLPELHTFGCYVEGFKPHEGLQVAHATRQLRAQGKDVILYKVGRSEAGRSAASGHTAAIAGDWTVAQAILQEAGCMMAETFEEWLGLVMLSSFLRDRKPRGNRLAVISNAGYETVGMADHAEAFRFASYQPRTQQRIAEILEKYRLQGLQDIRNPMDLTPMAVDHAHAEVLQALAQDDGVDLLMHGCVPLTPAMKTREPGGPEGKGTADPESFASLVRQVFQKETDKPLVVVVDSGSEYDAMAQLLLAGGVPVFRSADTAMQVLAKWVKGVTSA